MILDHFVIHMDDDPAQLEGLKTRLDACGVPFEPDWGKGTKGFRASNIWIGRQYFEIIRILRPDGGGWVPQWVARHQQGQRGLYCLFLKTDRLDDIAETLRAAGVETQGPERITFRAFFGLLKKSMPWRVLYLPPIPGTGLEFGFIEYDPDPKGRLKAHMVPNADENGLTGVTEARIRLPLTEDTAAFIQQVFPDTTTEAGVLTVPLADGSLRVENAEDIHIDFYADKSDPTRQPGTVSFQNTTLHV